MQIHCNGHDCIARQSSFTFYSVYSPTECGVWLLNLYSLWLSLWLLWLCRSLHDKHNIARVVTALMLDLFSGPFSCTEWVISLPVPRLALGWQDYPLSCIQSKDQIMKSFESEWTWEWIIFTKIASSSGLFDIISSAQCWEFGHTWKV